MQSWWAILVFIVSAAFLHLVVAFFVLRGLETMFGVPAQTNTARRALISLPVVGALGLPFLFFPLVAPFVGTIASGFVAAIMVG
jgi:hypothetical protein